MGMLKFCSIVSFLLTTCTLKIRVLLETNFHLCVYTGKEQTSISRGGGSAANQVRQCLLKRQ